LFASPDARILHACRTLFGAEVVVSPRFLLSLKPNVLKTAFRKKAKETHPDLFAARDPFVQKRQAELFRVVNEAYDIMRSYCESPAQLRAHAPRRAAASTPSFDVNDGGWLYQGIVPERRMEIGRYLYYRGRIPYHTLLKALAWQMQQRPAVGVIARNWGWLNEDHVRSILAVRGVPSPFGQRALQLGLLTSYQARILVAYQRTLQKKLGQYFVDHGLIPRDEIEQLVADLNRHNARFAVYPVADWRAS
jgi:hypothetical protein